MDRFGVVQGRFQMIHQGHMEYFLAAKERCEFLYIGICDEDPDRAYFHASYDPSKDAGSEPHRSLVYPLYIFTFLERMLMVKRALERAGVPPESFIVGPFPVQKPHLLKYYLPQDAVVYVTIYDDWGEKKLGIFENLGYRTSVLWRRTMDERFTTATEVRRRMAAGEPWAHLVPEGVAEVIEEMGLSAKLAKLPMPKDG